MTIDEVLAIDEKQIFDRKSVRIKPADLSATICAFANADGGIIAIGVSDKTRKIEGVDRYLTQLNDILRAPIDFCNPTPPVKIEMIECVNDEGKPDHVLLMRVEASPLLHANQADEVYLRVGDKSKKLDFNDRINLMYAKGVRYYEDEPVADATIRDLDLDFVASYCKRIRYPKSPEEYVRENKRFVTIKNGKDQTSVAAILLFGKNPQLFFPRARVRFIRYDGVEEKVGSEMNVVKDVVFEGRILEQTRKAIKYVKTQMKERTRLASDGVFVTEEEYGEFVRTEIVVNAVAHRDYSIKGTEIQVKMFDDRLEVDSPGILAGMVNKNNIRRTHFSRNPKIAAFLKDYGYVKEYGEGVDRMCRELEAIGLPAPVFDNSAFILKTTVRSALFQRTTNENASIDRNDASIQPKNAQVEGNDASIHTETASIVGNDALLEKLRDIVASGQISANDASAVETVIRAADPRNALTSETVMETLSCRTTKARRILKIMEVGSLITPVRGKGRYVLNIPKRSVDEN